MPEKNFALFCAYREHWPLLFKICIKDLTLTSKLQVRLFADDTNLTASLYNKDTLAKLVINELVHISNG